MSLSDKLITIAQNEKKIHHKGQLDIIKSSRFLTRTERGKGVSLLGVSPIEHDLQVQLSSDTITDFSNVKVNQYGLNLLKFPYRNNATGETYEVEIPLEPKKGVTFTILKDGRIKANGTSTGEIYLNIGDFRNTGIDLDLKDKFSMSQYLAWNAYYQMAYLGIKANTVFNDTIIEPMVYLKGVTPTKFEPYIEPRTVISSVEGIVEGVTNDIPNMTLLPDTEGVTISATYIKDIDKVYTEISGKEFTEIAQQVALSGGE